MTHPAPALLTRIIGFLYFHVPPLWELWARYRCPYPIGKPKSARACFKSGKCGCDNAKRFR